MKDAMKILCKVCLSVAFFLTPLSALAQAQISGQVVDKTGETVIGATIVEKGNPQAIFSAPKEARTQQFLQLIQ